MSLREDLISDLEVEIVFVRDDNGGEFACIARDLSDQNHVKESEKQSCIDISLIFGRNW